MKKHKTYKHKSSKFPPEGNRAAEIACYITAVQLLSSPLLVSFPTFRSFHQFDLCDAFARWTSPQDVQSDDRPRLLQGLHGEGVSDLPNVHVIDEHDAVVHPAGRERQVICLHLCVREYLVSPGLNHHTDTFWMLLSVRGLFSDLVLG